MTAPGHVCVRVLVPAAPDARPQNPEAPGVAIPLPLPAAPRRPRHAIRGVHMIGGMELAVATNLRPRQERRRPGPVLAGRVGTVIRDIRVVVDFIRGASPCHLIRKIFAEHGAPIFRCNF